MASQASKQLKISTASVLIVFAALLATVAFWYWFEYRPSLIRDDCMRETTAPPGYVYTDSSTPLELRQSTPLDYNGSYSTCLQAHRLSN